MCDGFFTYLWVANEMRIIDLMLQEKMIQDAENICSIDMNFESLQLFEVCLRGATLRKDFNLV